VPWELLRRSQAWNGLSRAGAVIRDDVVEAKRGGGVVRRLESSVTVFKGLTPWDS